MNRILKLIAAAAGTVATFFASACEGHGHKYGPLPPEYMQNQQNFVPKSIEDAVLSEEELHGNGEQNSDEEKAKPVVVDDVQITAPVYGMPPSNLPQVPPDAEPVPAPDRDKLRHNNDKLRHDNIVAPIYGMPMPANPVEK